MASQFLKAEWRKLAIANYAIDPALLSPYLPYKTVLDLWNGKCYVSLVGFMFLNTMLKNIPIPFHRNFEEVNLRFYVKYKDSTGWKRGVTFIKEIVPLPALSFIANAFYKEKYVTLPMDHKWGLSDSQVTASYSWKYAHKWNELSVTCDSTPQEIAIHSEEEFITEHYWGYTPISTQKSSEYGVEHPRWMIYQVKEYKVDVEFDKIYNKDFSFLNSQKPDSVMLAEGSEIIVRSMRTIS